MTSLEPPFAVDRAGMTARIDGIPEQIDGQIARLEGFRWAFPADPTLLAIGGLGGSAIAAELTGALIADRAPRPWLVVREYGWPAAVRAGALAFLCSYSGETEETLALYRDAASRGVARVALTTGGTLGAWCARDGIAAAPLPSGSPPRAALYASWVSVTHLAGALGWMDDPIGAWRAATALLRERRETLGSAAPERGNAAKQLARRLATRRVFVYAGSERVGAVATRFRQQLNENAKMLGHSATAPELNHNEIVGWENPGDAWRDTAIVVLRDREDRPEVARRLALTGEYVTRQGGEAHVIEAPDGPRLARMAALAQFADYLSLYLAVERGIDPTPIASIDEFKRRLAESAAARGH
ncbi:MAG: bifunctional phosphoglucose/phosphomannose isomerase [Candidatus Eisenbacteria bacterium]